jgi:pilus assembly protein CpaB
MNKQFGSRGYSPDRGKALVFVSVAGLVFFSAAAYLLIGAEDAKTVQSKAFVEVVKETPIDMVEVLIPIQSIEQGKALEPSLFRKEKRVKNKISPKSVRSFDEIVNSYSRTLILSDQPLHADYITKTRPINEIIQQIPEGFRAVTIRVDQISSVEGWARPGSLVDVVWASKVNGQAAVTVIVEGAKILSAERITENQNQGQAKNNEEKGGAPTPSTVTLLVSSDDANKIQLATTAGTLSLNLRGETGGGAGQTGGTITVDDLLLRKGPEEKKELECKGRLKTCAKDGKCETLCMRADGTLVPMESP